jgi:hypothetical protein
VAARRPETQQAPPDATGQPEAAPTADQPPDDGKGGKKNNKKKNNNKNQQQQAVEDLVNGVLGGEAQ